MALVADEDNLATLAGFIGKDHPIVEADADDQVVVHTSLSFLIGRWQLNLMCLDVRAS